MTTGKTIALTRQTFVHSSVHNKQSLLWVIFLALKFFLIDFYLSRNPRVSQVGFFFLSHLFHHNSNYYCLNEEISEVLLELERTKGQQPVL